MGIHIRHPAPDEIEAVRAVVGECAPVLVAHAPYLYWVILAYHSRFCAVAEADGKIVGVCLSIMTGPERYLLWQLGVLPAFRGQGIARRLVDFMFDVFTAEGAVLEMTLDRANAASLTLFKDLCAARKITLRRKEENPFLLQTYNEDLYALDFRAQE